MFIKQLSIFVENMQGRLAKLTKCLGENDIDLLAASIADTTEFGMLRIITNDCDKAINILHGQGYAVTVTNVLAVQVKDEPGGLASALELLDKNNISIEYLYSFVRHIGEGCVIIIRTDKAEKAAELLIDNGNKLFDQDELSII